MQNLFADLQTTMLTPETISTIMKVGLILVIGFLMVNIIKVVVIRSIRQKVSAQTVMITRKTVFYTGGFFVLFIALREAGLDLNILLGTAGVAGIAIGFASQTSISNIISSIFLMSEKPFEVNDAITVGDKTGVVMSIDLLSVKIRTFANTFIRIPNETIIKSDVINITRFPIRRLDINLKVDFREDVERVKELLFELARKNPYCLDNPEPLFIINGFGESSLELFFGVWFEKNDFIQAKNSILLEIRDCFVQNNISFPYPGLRVYTQPHND